ncbi:MAG: glycosyltransferase family 8 protein [Clostridiales bacterium]|jgi:lipopolysaccharide biosynthesis glycosyltransferase|nr:glycosyltransferase family 8 protein [Clostridiales bacterium]
MTINITLSLNRGFVRQATVAMYSILANASKDTHVQFWLLNTDLRPADVEYIHSHVDDFGTLDSIHIVAIQESDYCLIACNQYFGKEAGLRLFVAKYLDLERVLHIDCDVLVLGDLSELYKVDLVGKAYAAVSEKHRYLLMYNPTIDPIRNSIYKVLDKHGYDIYQEGVDYVNSGVMLINCDYWRRHNYAERAIKWFGDNQGETVYPDQDCLNILALQDGIDSRVIVDSRYNTFASHFKYDKEPTYGYYRTVFETMGLKYNALNMHEYNPIVVHYAGADKPWQGAKTLYRDIYLEYALKIGWNASRTKFKVRLKQLARYWLPHGILMSWMRRRK